jgi:hypothetical protein
MTSEGSKQADASPRPEGVVWYERLAWTALAVGLASAAANPAAIAKYYERYHIGYLIMGAVSVAGQLLWIWLVARKRQNWARWISLIVTLIGIPTAIWDINERFQLNPVASIFFCLAFATSIVAVMLLFRADSREWFAR